MTSYILWLMYKLLNVLSITAMSKMDVNAGTSQRFRTWWGKLEFKQKYKFANRENPYPGGWSWGTCKHLLRLRFHCEFSDFHLIFYLLPKRGGGNSKIVQFSICKLEKKFNARKIGAPFPPSSPLSPFQSDATCLFWFFLLCSGI